MLKNFLVLLYVALVWALAFLFIKVEESTIPPITIMAGRAFLAFLTLFIAALITRKDLVGNFKNIGKFVVFAILGMSLFSLGLAFGQEYLSVGLASVMITTIPLVTFILLVLVLRVEPFHVMGLIGLIFGIVGIVLVIGISKIPEDSSTVLGVLLIGGGFLCLAINGILAEKWARGIDPVITATYFLGLGTVILVVLAFIFESPLQVPWTKETIAGELALGIICTGSGFLGYYFIINRAGAYFSSFIFYFIPVFGLLVGHIFLGEKVDIPQIVGVGTIIAGVYLVNRDKFKKGS